jgi:hypothetical protein
LYLFPGVKDASTCDVQFSPDRPDAVSAAASADFGSVLAASDDGALALFSFPGSQEALRLARRQVPQALTPEQRKRFFLAE